MKQCKRERKKKKQQDIKMRHIQVVMLPWVCVCVYTLLCLSMRSSLHHSYLSLSSVVYFFQLPPSVAAGSDHNVAAHHNSPLEGFQKFLTKKVRGLWRECVLCVYVYVHAAANIYV